MEKIERKVTVMNVEDFINEHSKPKNDPMEEYYRKEREAVMNDINDLYEDSYKELYLDKCDDYDDLKQLYDFEVLRNESLKQENEDLTQIVLGYKLLIKDKEIIDEMNKFIEVRQKRIARVIERGKRRTYGTN